MQSIQQKAQEADLLIDRMRAVRSAAHSHADELQGDSKRLVDWKEYVLTMPLASVAAASILGFAITRSAVSAVPKTLTRRSIDKSDQSDDGSVKSTLASSAFALGSSIVSSALKSYFANLVQRSISEGGLK